MNKKKKKEKTLPVSVVLTKPITKEKSKAGLPPRGSGNSTLAAKAKKHPPPPSRLPADHFKKAKQLLNLVDMTPLEEEMDSEEQNSQDIDPNENLVEEDNDGVYFPVHDEDVDDDDDSNSFDHNDTMSEDDEVEKESLHVSSGEDKESAKAKEKQDKGSKECIENSLAWDHFEKVMVHTKEDPKGPKVLKARCNHCTKHYAYKQGSSTSTLNRHWKKCKHRIRSIERVKMQKRLGFKPINGSENSPMGNIGFEQSIIKELIAKMIMVHEYSFRMVEHEWFNIVMKYLNPLYQSIGRKAIRAECMRVYKKAKEMLKLALKDVEYISLTTDLWTSNQTLSYMCVVAHYIDANWNMQTRVLAFMELEPPHSGHVIADALWDCVKEWKIENKVISITLDNASNNDVAISDLKAKFDFRKSQVYVSNYFHVRCCAHIINLVVQDGTACMTTLSSNLRETVKYFKKSVSRMKSFVGVCRDLNLNVGAHLTLDVSTRWSSTYKMISTGLPYKEALKSYAISDRHYQQWLPSDVEWDLFELIKPMLFSLSQVTTAFSGSLYPTANIFYPHIVSIKISLVKAMKHKNATYKAMGEAMMDKFNKYWEEKNNVMVLATILDPRYKLLYIEWAFNELYDKEKAQIETEEVRNELFTLFEKFDKEKKLSNKSAPSSSKSLATNSMPASDGDFLSWRSNTVPKASKSELRNYLEDPGEDVPLNDGATATSSSSNFTKKVQEAIGEERSALFERFLEKRKIAKTVQFSAAVLDFMIPSSTSGLDVQGVEVPEGIGNLNALQTLGVVNVSAGRAILSDLQKLTQLRKLGVTGINRKNSQNVLSAIGNLTLLINLSIGLEGNPGLHGCLDHKVSPPKQLQGLKLYGNMVALPTWISQLQSLSKLKLQRTRLHYSLAMQVLEKLPHLSILRLWMESFQDKKLVFHFQRDSFPSLTVLELAYQDGIKSITISEGAMPNLELLQMKDCIHDGNGIFSGLSFLRKLKEVVRKGHFDANFMEHLRTELDLNPNKPVLVVA